MGALAVQERALPGGANDTALRRLAVAALEFAKHVPNLAGALEIGVRESLAGGLMLVPSAADKSNTANLLWVPSRGSGRGSSTGAPVVQQHASAVARAAEGVVPGVRTARAALDRHRVRVVDPGRQGCGPGTQPRRRSPRTVAYGPWQPADTVPPPLSSPLPSLPPGAGRACLRPRPLTDPADRRPEPPWPVWDLVSTAAPYLVTRCRRFAPPVTIQTTEGTGLRYVARRRSGPPMS